LQKELAAIPETRDIEVVNWGVGAAVSLQEVERLEYEIKRNNVPDFCVFFNGINDTLQGVFNGQPGGTMMQAEQEYLATGLFVTLKRLARLSVAARTIYHSIVSSQRQNDPAPRTEARVHELAQATADVYEQNMIRAKDICDRHHIRMMVFLQPHVHSIAHRPLTANEQIAANKMRKGLTEALRVCYPLLRGKLARLAERGVMAYDVSDAFDANFEPIFVDEYHVESTGNQLIAEAILKHALPVLKNSSSIAGAPDRQARR
jgi:lysophospholipase L1-like esterase